MKKIGLRIIKYIPFYSIKNILYRKLYQYKIGKNVKIGRSFIGAKNVEIGDNVTIAHQCVISCSKFYVGENTKIQSQNIFIGGAVLRIGSNSRIINQHYFDLWNNISIGNNTWIAGKSSQFWTHGSLKTKLNTDLSILIGDNVYVGSAVKFGPGTKVANNNLIALGAVVSGVFGEEYTIIAGNLAGVVKTNVDWRENW